MEDQSSLLVFNTDGTVNWEKSHLTEEEKNAVWWKSKALMKSPREALEDQGYLGIPIKRAQRAHHSAFAGSKVALVANAGDMAPAFEQHRQEHIENDPLVIEHFVGAICPIPDAIRAGTGHNLAGDPLSTPEILGATAITAIGVVGLATSMPEGILDDVAEHADDGRSLGRIDDVVGEVGDAVDAMEDARRMSGRGRMGGVIAKGSALQSLMNEAKSLNIPVVTNDALLDKLPGGGKAAAFDYSSGTIIIRSDATELEIFHELQHAKHWVALGRDPKAYTAIDVFAREFYVYRQIMDNKARWSPRELSEATRQITEYFQDYLKRIGSGT